MKPVKLVISCEHAVNTVPVNYQALFKSYENLLNSHEGIDFGALAIANYLSDVFACELIAATATRLLIDCNRSLSHRGSFSSVTQPLTEVEKTAIINQFYLPFRQKVDAVIGQHVNNDYSVCHLSIHSFTPQLNGVVRNADIGLLYDPKRLFEKKIVKQWQQELKQADKRLRVRLNYPYRGVSDGFTSALRKKYPDASYAGIEVECNQGLMDDNQSLAHVACVLATTLSRSGASPDNVQN